MNVQSLEDRNMTQKIQDFVEERTKHETVEER
jgi:hypothetical protein